MGGYAITRGGAVRRGLSTLLAGALLAAALSSCGAEGRPGPTTAVPDRELDAEVLNGVLSRQLGAVAAYRAALPGLRGADRALAERMREHEQEHVNAVTKALRGIGAAAEAEPEAIPLRPLGSREERLRFLYELESATVDAELKAITQLTGAWPRALLATIVANQSQHLALLRQRLGAGLAGAVPAAFENGTLDPPRDTRRPATADRAPH